MVQHPRTKNEDMLFVAFCGVLSVMEDSTLERASHFSTDWFQQLSPRWVTHFPKLPTVLLL
jgi:hypothetical protein